MALYIPLSILHLARLLHVRPEILNPTTYISALIKKYEHQKKTLLKPRKVMATPVLFILFSECRKVTKTWRRKTEMAARHHDREREIIKVKMQWE
jgi:hypothetical protein